MIKETNKTLMIEVENRISIGNDAIEATVFHQVCLYENSDGGISADVDFTDITDISFMGIKLEDQSYTGFRKFKEKLLELGVNVDEQIDEECAGLIGQRDIQNLKQKYRTVFS